MTKGIIACSQNTTNIKRRFFHILPFLKIFIPYQLCLWDSLFVLIILDSCLETLSLEGLPQKFVDLVHYQVVEGSQSVSHFREMKAGQRKIHSTKSSCLEMLS